MDEERHRESETDRLVRQLSDQYRRSRKLEESDDPRDTLELRLFKIGEQIELTKGNTLPARIRRGFLMWDAKTAGRIAGLLEPQVEDIVSMGKNHVMREKRFTALTGKPPFAAIPMRVSRLGIKK